MTEAQFQRAVIDLARTFGWRVAHFRAAMRQSGRWSTPVAADGAGFPDLVLARPGRVLFRELKTTSGSVKPAQRAWLAALVAGGADAGVWRPDDWPLIERTLRGRGAAPVAAGEPAPGGAGRGPSTLPTHTLPGGES